DSKGHGAANDPNNFQNFPVLTSALQTPGGVQITGTLTQSVSPNTTYRIEFYASNADPLGQPAEGQTFLAAITLTTDATGVANITATLNLPAGAGSIFTATATNLTADPSALAGSAAKFNTSEFSPSIALTVDQFGLRPNPDVNTAIVKGLYHSILNRDA